MLSLTAFNNAADGGPVYIAPTAVHASHAIHSGLKSTGSIRCGFVVNLFVTRSPAKARFGRPYCPINLILTLSPSLIDF